MTYFLHGFLSNTIIGISVSRFTRLGMGRRLHRPKYNAGGGRASNPCFTSCTLEMTPQLFISSYDTCCCIVVLLCISSVDIKGRRQIASSYMQPNKIPRVHRITTKTPANHSLVTLELIPTQGRRLGGPPPCHSTRSHPAPSFRLLLGVPREDRCFAAPPSLRFLRYPPRLSFPSLSRLSVATTQLWLPRLHSLSQPATTLLAFPPLLSAPPGILNCPRLPSAPDTPPSSSESTILSPRVSCTPFPPARPSMESFVT